VDHYPRIGGEAATMEQNQAIYQLLFLIMISVGSILVLDGRRIEAEQGFILLMKKLG
jgi:hypothetical protein